MDTAQIAAVTWTQLGVMVGAMTLVLGVVSGWAWKSQAAIWKELSEIRQHLDEARIKTAETYATNAAMIEVERRLASSIDRLSNQMGHSLAQMTTRFENVIMQLVARTVPPSSSE